MEHEKLVVLTVATICLGLGCAQTPRQGEVAAGAEDLGQIDPMLLKKVHSLYPDTRLQPSETDAAFFWIVREVLRAPMEDGTERIMVEVRWHSQVSPGLFSHGGGDYLLFKDAEDEVPISKVWTFGVRDPRLVENKWVRFGNGPLVSLLEDESMRELGKDPGGLLANLARPAAAKALDAYLSDGLDALIKLAPIHETPSIKDALMRSLPARVSRVEMYPSRVEDFREARFRYSTPWEGTVLVRVTPTDPTQAPVVLEMGAFGRGDGIEIADVELSVIKARTDEPTDRPAPDEELLQATDPDSKSPGPARAASEADGRQPASA